VILSTLNVVGCGRLGQAIAKLLVSHGVKEHVRVCNRSRASGEHAVAVIGRGVAYESLSDMPPSNLWLIGSGDQEIGKVAHDLADHGALSPRSVVFHCSGILSSEVLAPLRAKGALVGSVHPVRSFADADIAVREFSGTYCSVEGDPEAVQILEMLFTGVGARVFSIPSDAKMLCHAGHVFASNYLVALLECSRRLYVAAGVPEELAVQIMQPLVHGTLQNVSRLGHAQALTGPIARGESGVVAQQLAQVAMNDPLLGALYHSLGRIAVELARAQGLSPEKCAQVEAAFAEPT
jgi:predicted short-subunit dehydrogenase-like oxidoreductase (DUF2520 family)